MSERLPSRRFLPRALAPLLLLAGVLIYFEYTQTDLVLQDRFYNFATGRWWIDAKEQVGRAVFYNGPKALVWLVALTVLVVFAGPARWRARLGLTRRSLGLALLSFATIPALAGLGKRLSGVHCPSDLFRYGGQASYEKLCSPRSTPKLLETKGGCFPAGHASGGFAFWGLIALRDNRRWRRIIIGTGLGLGWWMGGYQMLKGAHFLSHTLVTLLLAWLVVLLWRQAVAAWPRNEVSLNPAPIRPHDTPKI